MQSLIVIGGGEFARVVIETAELAGWEVLGFVDANAREETAQRTGKPHLGDDRILPSLPADVQFILGVGCIKVSDTRQAIVQRLNLPRDRWASIVHPAASVSRSASLAQGSIVLAGAVVATGASIGAHDIINLGAKIDHDCRVGDFVHICPQAALGGCAEVDDGSFIGMGAIVRDHTRVAEKTMVGLGTVVNKPFPAHSVLVGVPARQLTP
jgi:acetyltransferase EpsM